MASPSATRPTNNSNLSSAPSSGSTRLPSGSGNGSGNPFGNGSPFGGVFGNSGNSGNSGNGNSGNGNSGNGNSGSSGGSGPSDASAIAAKVDPGLVDINTTLGYAQQQAAGTGIVLSSNGVILTNNHVINGATKISVTDVGNQKTYTAKVVGYDRSHDIAVLQLQNASGLQTAPLATSHASVGQDVVGVGNAGGTGGTPSAAGGTVTALNQSITASDQGDGTSEQLTGLIETNADIQPGDSGGALVNTSGQVIGVDTAASAGYSFQFNGQSQGNQGFAIPINTALSIARQIEAGNGVLHGAHRGDRLPRRRDQPARAARARASNGGFGGVFGGNSGNTGSSVSGRLGGRRGHQRAGPGGRHRPGRRHHLPRWQDHRLGQRPDQRHAHLPPGRQGDHRLDRQLRPEPHGHASSCPPARRSRAAPSSPPTRRLPVSIPDAGGLRGGLPRDEPHQRRPAWRRRRR